MNKNGNISVHDQVALNEFAERLNDRPREVLGWRTPNEIYRQLLADMPLVPDAIKVSKPATRQSFCQAVVR